MKLSETAAKMNLFSLVTDKTKVYDLVLVISFAILTAVSAQIAIPIKPIPITLQTLAVILAGAVLGAKKGAYSQVLYLGLGLTGLPVFAAVPDGLLGLARLIGPTGGFLLAFPLGAYITGKLIEKNGGIFNASIAMFTGQVAIIILGSIYFDLLYFQSLEQTLKAALIIFSIPTLVKVVLGVGILKLIKK